MISIVAQCPKSGFHFQASQARGSQVGSGASPEVTLTSHGATPTLVTAEELEAVRR